MFERVLNHLKISKSKAFLEVVTHVKRTRGKKDYYWLTKSIETKILSNVTNEPLKNLISILNLNSLSANSTKMVKHTQTICQLLPTNCLSVFDHFVGLVFKGLNLYWGNTVFVESSSGNLTKFGNWKIAMVYMVSWHNSNL